MNTKKQYTAPTLKVVDVEVHLMLGVSADGTPVEVVNDSYYNNTDYDDIN